MDEVAEKLDTKLQEWLPATAEVVRNRVNEIIELADQDALDIILSRSSDQ